MMDGWTDREFLDYVDLHSRTERAMFSRDHANRLLRLCGMVERHNLPSFVSMFWDEIGPLVKQARDRISTSEASR